jgi:filamentous hemagglutinin family protein
MKNHTAQAVYGTIGAVTFGLAMNATTVQAQIIATPTGDPGATGTIVTPTNTQIDITGGTQAGSALFHSFTQFDVSQGQTANFQTPADVQNVLTRVTNGVPSTIDGTLQLSGAKANLYFMNPAGIVFGPNASFNLPASFTGTTASRIIREEGLWKSNFFATGNNTYESFSSFSLKPTFDNTETGDILVHTNRFSLPSPYSKLSLSANTISSTVPINTPSELWLDATGNVTTSDIVSTALVAVRGKTIQTGNIEAESIQLFANGTIQAKHLKTFVHRDEITSNAGMMGVASSIGLYGQDIAVSSLFAHSDATKDTNNSSGNVFVQALGSFKVIDTIPTDSRLGRIQADMKQVGTSQLPISIAASNRIGLKIGETNFNEATGLERDSQNHVIYRLASKPETLVDIIAINPNDGSLILKNRITNEIVVGDSVVLQSANPAIELVENSTKGLIVRLDRLNGSLVELTGTAKRPINQTTIAKDYGSSDYSTNNYRTVAPDDSFPRMVTVEKFQYVDNPMFAPPAQYLKAANAIGGPLPGSYSGNIAIPDIQFQLLNLPPEVQAAIDQHNQRTAAIATPAPTPEAPTSPKIDQSSILNATIDPSDTINLSAGAIRGAAINPGGLLKVELDTRNPEGVLTRKVTTK